MRFHEYEAQFCSDNSWVNYVCVMLPRPDLCLSGAWLPLLSCTIEVHGASATNTLDVVHLPNLTQIILEIPMPLNNTGQSLVLEARIMTYRDWLPSPWNESKDESESPISKLRKRLDALFEDFDRG